MIEAIQDVYRFLYSHIEQGDYSLSLFLMLLGLAAVLKYIWWALCTTLKSSMFKLISLVYQKDLRKYGEWAVVTGSTDGIGKAYAIELAKRKMNIVLISRNMQKLEKTAVEIRKQASGINVKIIQADFSHGFHVYDYIQQELKDLEVGILVNNVGIAPPHPTFRKVDGTEPLHLYNEVVINNGAPSQMTRMILPQMKQRQRGIILFVGSLVTSFACPYFTNYASTKMFVSHYAKCLRREISHHNIDVNIVLPSITDTNLTTGDHVFNKMRGSLRALFYPDATTYVRWAICSLGWCNTAPGYWFCDTTLFTIIVSERLGLIWLFGKWLLSIVFGREVIN